MIDAMPNKSQLMGSVRFWDQPWDSAGLGASVVKIW